MDFIKKYYFFPVVFGISIFALIFSREFVHAIIPDAQISQPTADSVWGTALPMDCVDAHPHFQWTNPTGERALLSIIYQGKYDEEPSRFKPGDEQAILTTGPGDQNIGWNPADNIYDGRWKMKLIIGDITLVSETFGISSKG